MNLLTTSRLGLIVVVMSVGPLFAQTNRSTPAQKQQPPQPYGRSSYDPMARGQGPVQPKGIVETTLGAVNPQDKDYGSVVADWRKEIFENTLQTFYFWSLLATTLALGVSIVGNGWLLRQREQRLAVSGDIVAQLYNAYVASRARTLEVIGKHNRLVEKYNRLDTETAELRGRIANAERKDPAADNQAELNFNTAMKDRVPALSPEPNRGGSEVSEAKDNGAATTELELLRAKLTDTELELQRKVAQLEAKTNEVINLRSRLSKAHDAYEGQIRKTNSRL